MGVQPEPKSLEKTRNRRRSGRRFHLPGGAAKRLSNLGGVSVC